MKTLKEILESSILDIEDTMKSGDQMTYDPKFILNDKYKNFKELIEALAKYFDVKVPDIVKKEEVVVHLDGGFQIRRYYDVDTVTFYLKNSNTDINDLTVINTEGNYPVFVVHTDFVNGKLRRIPLYFVYGEIPRGFYVSEKPYKYKKDKFYDWCPDEFKEWLKTNQK